MSSFLEIMNFNEKKISGNYVAGLVQADGSFSVALSRKKRNDKTYFFLSPSFTIVQNIKYKDVILQIQKLFGNIGHWYINKSDNTIRYQITKQKDLLEVVIPFFIKYQLKSGKLYSFLCFKYILEVMASKAHVNNKPVLLNLIVIASNMNPLGKIGNSVRYLDKEEQKFIENNIMTIPEMSKDLQENIDKFVSNSLTLEYLHGLIDGDGNITVYLVPHTNVDKDIKYSIGCSFTIVQDIHNLSLLEEIKKYFNNVGSILNISNNCVLYKVSSKIDLLNTILPKLTNIGNIEDISDGSPEDPGRVLPARSLPLIKYNKFFYTWKILNSCPVGTIQQKHIFDNIIKWLYYVSKHSDTIELKEYLKKEYWKKN